MAYTVEQLKQGWANPNVRRLAYVIQQTEGASKSANPYASRGGDNTGTNPITDFSRHPGYTPAGTWYYTYQGKRLPSTAQGAYGALLGTWKDFEKEMGPMDFSPESQNLFFVWRLAKANQLQNVINGNIAVATKALTPVWSSLPGGIHSQITQQQFDNIWANTSPDHYYSSYNAFAGKPTQATQQMMTNTGSGTGFSIGGSAQTAGNKDQKSYLEQMLSSPDGKEDEDLYKQPQINRGDQTVYLKHWLTKPI